MSAPSPRADSETNNVVLGIHSVAYDKTQRDGGSAALIDGHAWISVTRNGKTQQYGLWPDNHGRVEDNGRTSDIRVGMEAGVIPKASRYYELTAQQARTLDAKLKENVTWSYANTCAS